MKWLLFVALSRVLLSQTIPIDIYSFDYPRIALQAKISGEVRLRLEIDKDGKIIRVEAVDGHPLLAKSAIQGVRDWRFGDVCGNNDSQQNLEVILSFELNGATREKPKSHFQYKYPNLIVIKSQVPQWVP